MKQFDGKNRMNDAFWKYNTEYVILWKKGERSNAEQSGRGSTVHVALFPQAGRRS